MYERKSTLLGDLTPGAKPSPSTASHSDSIHQTETETPRAVSR